MKPDGVTEPDDDTIVMFEYRVDRVVWFRSDSIAGDNGYTDGVHWFKAGDYETEPANWESVLKSEPNREPIRLVRAS